jgi:hypothetical protein
MATRTTILFRRRHVWLGMLPALGMIGISWLVLMSDQPGGDALVESAFKAPLPSAPVQPSQASPVRPLNGGGAADPARPSGPGPSQPQQPPPPAPPPPANPVHLPPETTDELRALTVVVADPAAPPADRSRALQQLATQLEDPAPLLALLVAVDPVTPDNIQIRAKVISHLGQHHELPQVQELLVTSLAPTTHQSERLMAISVMATIDAQWVKPHLEGASRDPDARVRQQASWSVRYIDSRERRAQSQR